MTFELVLHHRYTSGTCADHSGYANHGYPSAGTPGPDGMAFDGRTTRVVVFPARSLATLGGFRIRARVRLDELADRRTVMEGYLAFHFSVDPEGSLVGSFLAGQEWHLITSPPGAVGTGRWVDLGFVYDGRDHMALSVDGRTVAVRHANLGRVGGIEWPYGLNIGAWPDEAARVFSGQMAEIWLWRPSP